MSNESDCTAPEDANIFTDESEICESGSGGSGGSGGEWWGSEGSGNESSSGGGSSNFGNESSSSGGSYSSDDSVSYGGDSSDYSSGGYEGQSSVAEDESWDEFEDGSSSAEDGETLQSIDPAMTPANFSNSPGVAQTLTPFNMQVTCRLNRGGPVTVAKRRFVYCWEKTEDGGWVNIGLTVTDDMGIICDLEMLLKDLNDGAARRPGTEFMPLADLQVNAYNPSTKEWKLRPWDFFGETEDVVTFQKWLGEYIFSQEEYLQEQWQYFRYEELFGNTFGYDDFVFNREFFARDEYRLLFDPAREYVFTFCPPDIINKVATDSINTSQEIKIVNVDFTSPFASNNQPAIDLKFWAKPHECWTGTYTTKQDDTLSGIALRYGMRDWNDLYEMNKEVVGGNPNKLSVGMELKIPKTDDTLFFGTTFSPGNVENDNATGVMNFNLAGFQSIKHPYYIIELPVNLEEYLSLLSYYTLVFDMEYAEVIRSMEEYGKTGYKLQQISMFLTLMKKYPGFDEGKFDDAKDLVVYYLDSGEEPEAPAKGLEQLDALIGKVDALAEKIGKAACSDENAAYKNEKKELKQVQRMISSLFESEGFKKRVEQWKIWNEHIYAFNEGDRQLVFLPYSLRWTVKEKAAQVGKTPKQAGTMSLDLGSLLGGGMSGGGAGKEYEFAPVIYSCISKATCAVLMYGGIEKEDNATRTFYMKNVRPLERDLEIAFVKNDMLDGKKIATKLAEVGKDTFEGFTTADDWYNKTTLLSYDQYTEPSVLSYIFSDLLLKSIMPSIWNTQIGPASYLDMVMSIATVHRREFAIGRLLAGKNISIAASFLKIKLAQLRYSVGSSEDVCTSLVESFKMVRKGKVVDSNKNILKETIKKHKEKFNELDAGKGTIGKTKVAVSRITSSLQIALSLYDLLVFVEKYGNGIQDKEAFRQDFYQLYKSMHSGIVATSGLNLQMVERFPKLDRIFKQGAKVLRFGSAVAMFIDAYLFYQESVEAEALGEDFIMGMRTTQAIISASAGAYLLLTLCTPIPFIPALAALVGLTLLVLSIIEWIHEYSLKGTNKVIHKLREEILNSKFKQRDVVFRSEGKNFAFYGVTYVFTSGGWKVEYLPQQKNLKWVNPYQRYENVISKEFVAEWDSIATLIGKQAYWNIEVIPAGREMLEKGFTNETIAFVTMKRENLTGLEIKKIKGEPYTYAKKKVIAHNFQAPTPVPVYNPSNYRYAFTLK